MLIKALILVLLNGMVFLAQAQAPKLVLLTEYQQQNVDGWLMSEKLDGVRAYWDGHQLLSRQGNRFYVPDWFIEQLPPFELDGELWLGRGQFEQTLSIVRQQQPDDRWQQIGYYVFELPNQSGGLQARLAVLQTYLDQFPQPNLHLILQTEIKSGFNLAEHLKLIVAQGAEGLVLREPAQLYHTGRSPYALKLKPKWDAECTVTGYTEGKGKYQGQVGALLCLNDQQQLLRLGSGLTDALRAMPPELGSRITYQYNGYTQSGWPRHAVFLRVREDGF
ncbi:DNA ligase [Thiomicrospira microaerophila]|uniref:DNA ligase n=1 Tax=Thiomicrospira microaerophila TaxID=406020 RepID=UPI00200D1651|nr:DNA ligase [Thiomicrospira microaerophila]UQB42352.1 DNA ligase [Thiomicrospira microaerophila]